MRARGYEPGNRYFNRGPCTYTTGEGIRPYEFHWTMADHIQAVIHAGCTIDVVPEHGEREPAEDHEKWVPDSLPHYLPICGSKSL